ncbi:MAG TPA: MarR family transcriptional regulator [Megamonas funiformis]|nr:MarR family transcriptional regulator [Megamonas funiformis]
MKISKSAVSQLLLKLENEGFVIRKKYKNDKRSVTVELDEKGKIYKEEMKEFEKEILKKYYDGFTVTELDNMLELIKKSRDILL